MKRRVFIGTVAGAFLTAPLAAGAQPAGKVWRIGYLSESVVPATLVDRSDVCVQGLLGGFRELGYTEGYNLLLEPRSAEGRQERLPVLASDLVRLGVDAIVTTSNETARAAKQATAMVPIVMATSLAPVQGGLVTSLARPGGNLTGLTIIFDFNIDGKRLQLFKEAVPTLSRLGVVYRTPPSPPMAGQPFSVLFKELVAAAQSLHVTLTPVIVGGPDQLPAISAAIAREQVDGLYVIENPVNTRLRLVIGELTMKHRVPWAGGLRVFVEAGGLLTYGPSVPDLCRRAAGYADKIFRGAKPANLPIEQPTKFELVINLKTARALGLTIPPSLLQRADQVIE